MSQCNAFLSSELSVCFLLVPVSVLQRGHLGVPAGAGGRPEWRRSRRASGGTDAEQPPPPGVSLLPEHIRHSPVTHQLLCASWPPDWSSDVPVQQGTKSLQISFCVNLRLNLTPLCSQELRSGRMTSHLSSVQITRCWQVHVYFMWAIYKFTFILNAGQVQNKWSDISFVMINSMSLVL